jgi:tetratricopeptide (TPR) repeat protein
MRRLDEAIAEYREAIRLKKDHVWAHYTLGGFLARKGLLHEAITEYREAIHFNKDFAEAHCNLGEVLEQQGRFREALIERRRGHELGPKQAKSVVNANGNP